MEVMTRRRPRASSTPAGAASARRASARLELLGERPPRPQLSGGRRRRRGRLRRARRRRSGSRRAARGARRAVKTWETRSGVGGGGDVDGEVAEELRRGATSGVRRERGGGAPAASQVSTSKVAAWLRHEANSHAPARARWARGRGAAQTSSAHARDASRSAGRREGRPLDEPRRERIKKKAPASVDRAAYPRVVSDAADLRLRAMAETAPEAAPARYFARSASSRTTTTSTAAGTPRSRAARAAAAALARSRRPTASARRRRARREVAAPAAAPRPSPEPPGLPAGDPPGADEMRDAAMVSDVHSMLQMLEVSQVERRTATRCATRADDARPRARKCTQTFLRSVPLCMPMWTRFIATISFVASLSVPLLLSLAPSPAPSPLLVPQVGQPDCARIFSKRAPSRRLVEQHLRVLQQPLEIASCTAAASWTKPCEPTL